MISGSVHQKHSHISMNSPNNVRGNNKSTYLPYFKRFPNSKYLSQEKKRINEDYVDNSKSKPRRFFTQEKEKKLFKEKASFEKDKQSSLHLKNYSSGKLKEKTSKIRPRLLKQMYERQNKSKIPHSHHKQNSLQNRIAVNSSFTIHSPNYLTPTQVFRKQHNLTEFQKGQISSFSEIYYYGQNCTKKIDPLFFNSKKQTIDETSEKQSEGYNYVKHDHVQYRYQLLDILGQGSFGQVFLVFDHKYKQNTALKIVKNNEKYNSQAKIEIRLLNFIKSKDPLGNKNCIEIKDYFLFRSRICFTFPLLSMNLYELIKNNSFYGLPLDLIRRFVLQILNGIHFLHKHHIIHADLKPQNILLKENNKSGLKIIDFGSSCFQNETIYTYIQSRYYRGPEVILGLKYNRKIDIWSFGCIIAELHLGYPLFGGEDQHEQMCLLVEVLGIPPQYVRNNSKRWHIFYDKKNQLKPHEKRQSPASKSLKTALQNPPDPDFIDFISKCLEWDPQLRIEALDLLKHPWVVKELPPDFLKQHLEFIKEEEKQFQDNISVKRSRRTSSFLIKDKQRNVKRQ